MIFDGLLGMFSVDMGIDLGTCNTLVCVKGEGIVLNEPSVVAVKKDTNRVLQNGQAVGLVAKEMLGRTPGSISAIRPLKDGVISDFEITEAMLRYFIQRVQGRKGPLSWLIPGPRVVIAIPSGITAVEKRAVLDSAERAGARRVYLLEEPMAAAIGAGLPVDTPTGSMIVDIGGGTTDIAVIALSGIVCDASIRTAGDELDQAIVQFMRKTYNVLIGEPTAEAIKLRIGSALPLEEEITMPVKGRDLVSGLPRTVIVDSAGVRDALQESIQRIINAVRRALEVTPPELASDILDHGIVLTGGGAMIRGLDALLTLETGLPVKVDPDPLTCVVRGTGVILDDLARYEGVLSS